MVEQPIRNRQVVGSTPTLGSRYSRVGPGDRVTKRTGYLDNDLGGTVCPC